MQGLNLGIISSRKGTLTKMNIIVDNHLRVLSNHVEKHGQKEKKTSHTQVTSNHEHILVTKENSLLK